MTKKHALVIGSQLPPLLGVHPDTAAMTEVLGGLGFTVDRRIEGDATRAGILDGLDVLTRRCAEDRPTGDESTAVIYYAGHGGYALNAEARPGERERYQCIFPTDWTKTGEFRGILDVELSLRLARLTEATHNATVILDCCHSAEMWRSPDDELVPRVYGAAWVQGVPEFLARLQLDTSRLHVESNPHAVRLVAAEADRRAYERYVGSGRRGIFTYALVSVLEEIAGARLSWQTVGARVRELVLELAHDQRPAVEGPVDRVMFTTTPLRRPDAVVYYQAGGQHFLRANRILGATVGAEYHIMPPGAEDHDARAVVATAKVVELVGVNARLEVKNVDPSGPRPGSPAFPAKLPYPRLPVRRTGKAADTLDDVLRNSRLEVVTDEAAARFTVAADGATLELLDGADRAATPLPDDDAGRNSLIQRLERWSRAESVRNLVSDGLPPDALEVRWGRVEHGAAVEHGPADRACVGESMYVTVTNKTDQPLYFAIFDIGVGGKVTLLTSGSPGGRKLEPGKSSTLGKRDGEPSIRGIGPLIWPDDVPTDVERPESLVVIAATEWTEFALLETPVIARSIGGNRLEAVLDAYRQGAPVYRDLAGEDGAARRGFCVRRIDFDLSPTARTGFVIDQSVDARDLVRTVVARGLDSAGPAPTKIALRIGEITIHKNRALWGKAKVRVDTLALTGADPTHAFRSRTEVFPRTENGEILPLQDLLVYEGPIARFLDFGIWVSRDEGELETLHDLLDSAAQKGELKTAMTTLLGLAVTAPHAAVIAGAGLAVATVVSFASKLIAATVGNSIGLYRRSFLPHESFGVGRHPREGVIRAKDFSFTFSVDATGA